ncbi:MAG: manno-octulosonate cytidylyltransferase [Pseudomonadota bacterium]
MSLLVVIPARYASTRYPGKPLAMLKGATGVSRSLIERTWRAAREIVDADRIVVATDDARIETACIDFGAEVVMTSSACGNGTERCAEALTRLGGQYDIVVNLQGDAPLTPPWFIDALVSRLRTDRSADVATPVLRCDGRILRSFREDRANGRVGGTTAVFGQNGRALYFSKEVLPFVAQEYPDTADTPVFHHVGVYAYRARALEAYLRYPVGRLEVSEGLEQLRFMEADQAVTCVEVDARGRQFWELNNPEDISRIEQMMDEMHIA